jgi:hypothetical protein
VACAASPGPGATGTGGPRLTIGDIFRAHGAAYRQTHALNPQQRKAMRAIEACRTPVLGGRVEVCEQCGQAQVVYHSCRNRHCPTCQSMSQARWIEGRLRRLLPTSYFHVVFTIPDELLNGIILQNRELFFGLFFAAGSQTLLELGADPKRLGAQLGITSVLHTWTRDLRFHAHLHCIVTGGGLHPDGDQWLSTPRYFLFPVKVLSKLFRGKLLAAFDAAYRAGQLSLQGTCEALQDPKAFARLRDKLYKTEWISYAKEPFAGPEQVFRYLGRYTHRVGLSNQRLLDLTDEGVLFRTKGDATALLPPDQFIGRFLQHVLPRRFVKIRHYGLHAPANATTRLEVARRLLQAERPAPTAQATTPGATSPAGDPPADWRETLRRLTGIDPTRCRHCGGTLLSTPLSLPPRRPPDTS